MKTLQFQYREYEMSQRQNSLLKKQIKYVKSMLAAKEAANEFLRNQLKQAVQDIRMIKQSNHPLQCQCSCLPTPYQIDQMLYSIDELKKRNQALQEYNKSLRDYAGKIEVNTKVQNVKIQHRLETEVDKREESQNLQIGARKQEKELIFRRKPTFMMASVKLEAKIFQFQWDKKSFIPSRIQIIEELRIRRIARDNNFFDSMGEGKDAQKNLYQLGLGGCISSNNPFPKAGKHKVTFQIIQQSKSKAISLGVSTKLRKREQQMANRVRQFIIHLIEVQRDHLILSKKEQYPGEIIVQEQLKGDALRWSQIQINGPYSLIGWPFQNQIYKQNKQGQESISRSKTKIFMSLPDSEIQEMLLM